MIRLGWCSFELLTNEVRVDILLYEVGATILISIFTNFYQEVPKKIGSHIRRLKRTHVNPIPLFTPPNDALSRHQKKSLDLTRISQVQFSSYKWGWGLKILSSTIITDILTMSLSVFARRMVPLMLFRARECKIAIPLIKCPVSVHSTFKFDWNRTWMFQLLDFCDTI